MSMENNGPPSSPDNKLTSEATQTLSASEADKSTLPETLPMDKSLATQKPDEKMAGSKEGLQFNIL